MKKESIERCMKDMEHCNGIMHTVKSGDTLYSISLEHKVPLALLLRANPYVDVYNLQIGETICVPVKGNTQGGMPPYGSTCAKWEVRNAVHVTKDKMQREMTGQTRKEKETDEMQPAEEMTETSGTSSERQQDNTAVEETTLQDEKTAETVYVTKEGDSLEKILGVDKILLPPGMTLYRQK